MRRENSCLGFDFVVVTWRPYIEPNMDQWSEIALALKAGACQPYLDRRRDSLIPEIPPWHAAWPGLIQPLWPLDQGPSVARRTDQHKLFHTAGVVECA